MPALFRAYLDSLSGGNFAIANPGERWASSCTRFNDEPDKQFISAAILGDTLRMWYWQGQGIVSPERELIILGLVSGQVKMINCIHTIEPFP